MSARPFHHGSHLSSEQADAALAQPVEPSDAALAQPVEPMQEIQHPVKGSCVLFEMTLEPKDDIRGAWLWDGR